MPSNVRNFAILSYLSLLLGIVQGFLMFDESVAMAAKVGGELFVLGVQIGTIVVLAVLYFLIAFGRQNWARWLLLVLFVIGLPFVVLSYPALFSRAPVQGVVSLLQTVMQILALYLVFTGNAKAWFRKEKAVA